jgi:Ca-activated chloride channel family protein
MTGLDVSLNGLRVKDMYPRQVGDLFDGDQIVLVGRYDADDAKKLPREGERGKSTLVVKGKYEGKERAFEYPVSVNASGNRMYQFVEKLWAIRRVGWLLDEIQLRGKSQEIVDELVRLSRDYGIMTPYTSFLADEGTSGRVVSAPMGKGESRGSLMKAMEKSDVAAGGVSAQSDGMMRQQLREAKMAPAPSAPGAGGGTTMYGWGHADNYEAGKKEQVDNLRQAGEQSLYRRGQVWVAADAAEVDLDKDKAKIQEVQRFSTEYFALVKANTVRENQVLASQRDSEELVVRLRGQLYRIR